MTFALARGLATHCVRVHDQPENKPRGRLATAVMVADMLTNRCVLKLDWSVQGKLLPLA